MGFETSLFIYNVGSMLIVLFLIPLLITALVWSKIICNFPFLRKVQRTISRQLMWNKPLLAFYEAYYMLALSVFINLKSISEAH
jgi:hypothetical protein